MISFIDSLKISELCIMSESLRIKPPQATAVRRIVCMTKLIPAMYSTDVERQGCGTTEVSEGCCFMVEWVETAYLAGGLYPAWPLVSQTFIRNSRASRDT